MPWRNDYPILFFACFKFLTRPVIMFPCAQARGATVQSVSFALYILSTVGLAWESQLFHVNQYSMRKWFCSATSVSGNFVARLALIGDSVHFSM